jgi:hypothetical protein
MKPFNKHKSDLTVTRGFLFLHVFLHLPLVPVGKDLKDGKRWKKMEYRKKKGTNKARQIVFRLDCFTTGCLAVPILPNGSIYWSPVREKKSILWICFGLLFFTFYEWERILRLLFLVTSVFPAAWVLLMAVFFAFPQPSSSFSEVPFFFTKRIIAFFFLNIWVSSSERLEQTAH